MKSIAKKNTLKSTQKTKKQETELEALARLVRDGFERMDQKFEQVDARFEKIDSRFEKVDSRFDLIDRQFSAVHHELQDHSRRLDRIERNQSTMLTNLDETIHRSEFTALLKRVDILEKKTRSK